MNEELKAMVLIAVAMWVSTAVAVSIAVVLTHSAAPIWFMLIPGLRSFGYETPKKEA